MFGRLIRLVTLTIFATTQVSWAAPHIIPGAYPKAFRDMVHRPSAKKIRAAGSLHAASLATATGQKNIAVIVVQFPVGNASLISGSPTILDITEIDDYIDQMEAYYAEASFNALDLDFKFFGASGAINGELSAAAAGPLQMPFPSEYYGCWDEGVGCGAALTPTTSANGNYLIRDAIVAARTAGGTDLVSTEKVGGTYDAVVVVHAGTGNETTTGHNGDIWSIFYAEDTVISGTNPVSLVAQAAGFTEGNVVPETELGGITSPLGVMCHEFGHTIGLPDLYNTSSIGGDSVVGRWELMDTGPYLNGGVNPAHPGAWCKVAMGWITPTVITTKANASLTPIATSASMIQLPVQGSSSEYFLLEYRWRASGATFDRHIPGDGILVWHIDNDIATNRGINATNPSDQNTVNSGFPHYGVFIVPADGISIGSTGGSINNPYRNGSTFTSPASDSFSGEPSGVNIVNISGVGSATASFQVVNLKVTSGQNILKLINFPNPAGKGYAHPNGEGHTTIQMQLGRPANEYGFNIYTLSGDLVRKIGKGDISLNTDRSLDYKWVYEYVWDFTNGDGRMVAPGTYLYMGRADGEHANGKAVIIR